MTPMTKTVTFEAWMLNLNSFYDMVRCVFNKMRIEYKASMGERTLDVYARSEELTVRIKAVEHVRRQPEYLRSYSDSKFSTVEVVVHIEGEEHLVSRFKEVFDICTFRGGG